MSEFARVAEIGVITDFRGALATFGEDAKNALGAVDMEIRRTTDWLLRDRLLYWQAEIKQRRLDVAEAQGELFRRKISHRPGYATNDSDYKDALRTAKRRLEEAEIKLDKVKKWAPLLERAVAEYHSRSRPLADTIEGDLQRSLILLAKMVNALDAYINLKPPSLPSSVVLQGHPAAGATNASLPEGQAPDNGVAPPAIEPEPGGGEASLKAPQPQEAEDESARIVSNAQPNGTSEGSRA